MSCLNPLYAERTCGFLKIRPSGILAKGKSIPAHVHKFDHVTLLLAGSARVRLGAEYVDLLEPGAEVNVPAGVEHQVTALEDGTTYFCLYAHRDAEGKISRTPADERAYY